MVETPDHFGRKFDQGKTRWDLLPLALLRGVAQVLTYGAEKYAANSWQQVPDALSRYRSALARHESAILLDGEAVDAESGLPHAYHYLCNAMFVTYFLLQQQGPKS